MSNDPNIQQARFHETTVRLERIEGVHSDSSNNCGVFKILQITDTGTAAKKALEDARSRRSHRARRSKRQR